MQDNDLTKIRQAEQQTAQILNSEKGKNLDINQLLNQYNQLNERQLRSIISALNQGMCDSLGVSSSEKAYFINYLKNIIAQRTRRSMANKTSHIPSTYGRGGNSWNRRG